MRLNPFQFDPQIWKDGETYWPTAGDAGSR